MTKNEDKNAPGDGNNASNSMYSPAQSGTTLWQELIPVWFSFFFFSSFAVKHGSTLQLQSV